MVQFKCPMVIHPLCHSILGPTAYFTFSEFSVTRPRPPCHRSVMDTFNRNMISGHSNWTTWSPQSLFFYNIFSLNKLSICSIPFSNMHSICGIGPKRKGADDKGKAMKSLKMERHQVLYNPKAFIYDKLQSSISIGHPFLSMLYVTSGNSFFKSRFCGLQWLKLNALWSFAPCLLHF